MSSKNKFQIINKFKNSFKELYYLKNLTLISLFISMFIVLSFLTIKISNICYISFYFVFIAIIGGVFGPFVGFIAGFFADVLAYNIHPTEDFVIWYAFSVAMDGLIYGLILYKNMFYLKRVLFAQIFRDILINIIFNSICFSVQYGCNFFHILFFVRVPKNIIKIPINCFFMVFVCGLFKKILKNLYK